MVTCKRCFGVLVMVAVAGLVLGAQEDPRAVEAGPAIGEMLIQTIPAKHYLCGSIETDFQNMGEAVGKTLTAINRAAMEAKLKLRGPTVHLYHGGPHGKPAGAFKMETGFFVEKRTASPADAFQVRQLPEFRCASILYVGPATGIADAWQKLDRSLQAKGLTRTDEERELVLYWEGVNSPNNIVQLQVGMK